MQKSNKRAIFGNSLTTTMTLMMSFGLVGSGMTALAADESNPKAQQPAVLRTPAQKTVSLEEMEKLHDLLKESWARVQEKNKKYKEPKPGVEPSWTPEEDEAGLVDEAFGKLEDFVATLNSVATDAEKFQKHMNLFVAAGSLAVLVDPSESVCEILHPVSKKHEAVFAGALKRLDEKAQKAVTDCLLDLDEQAVRGNG